MERTRPAGDAEVERTDRSGPVCAASVADGCGPEDGLILQTGGELLALKWRFSRLLYTWRRENELTQEEAAERCGVSPRHYLDMEAGRVNPKLSTVIHIASESNISLDVLKSEVRGTHAVSLPPELVPDDLSGGRGTAGVRDRLLPAGQERRAAGSAVPGRLH